MKVSTILTPVFGYGRCAYLRDTVYSITVQAPVKVLPKCVVQGFRSVILSDLIIFFGTVKYSFEFTYPWSLAIYIIFLVRG